MQSAHCPAHPEETLQPARISAADRFWGCPGQFTYGVCESCGTHVLDPRPEPTDMGAYYAHYYSDAELVAQRAAYESKGGTTKGSKHGSGIDGLRAIDTIARLTKLGIGLNHQTTVLDVGCGLGGFIHAVHTQTGATVRGVDYNAKCQQFAAEVHGLEVDVGELRAQTYPEACFDVVTAWHYLEHVYDPVSELGEIARITRPGGFLVLEVPCPSLLSRLFRGRWLFLQAPTHLYHLNPRALVTLVNGAGFEPVRVMRPWIPSELAGSIVMALGLRGFAPRLLFGRQRLADKAWLGLFALLLAVDIPVTLLQALLGRSGVVRIIARRREL